MINFINNTSYISLFRNLNARPGTLSDFILPNDDLYENLGFRNEYDEFTLRNIYS